MVVGPGIDLGSVTDVAATGLDLLPTFAELAGFSEDLPKEIDGGSLVPLLTDRDVREVQRNSDYLIFHQASHRKPRSAIRKGDYKLVKYWVKESKYKNTPKIELFDLATDLKETTDLSEKFPEIVEELEKELITFLDQVNAETGERNIDGAFYRLKEDLGE